MPKKKQLRDRIEMILYGDGYGARIYSILLAGLVLVLCATFVIETYPIHPTLLATLQMMDDLITVVFLVDYLVRFWAKRYSWRYLLTPMAIIDLIAILPLFLRGAHWQFVRILRLFRVLRLLRVMRKGQFFGWTVTEVRLGVIRVLFTLFSIVFISAGLMFDVEADVEGTAFHTFFDALYFALVSLSTVGYGDIVPVSDAGRVVALSMIVAGGAIIPWQLTSLVRHFLQEIGRGGRQCKSCNLAMHDIDATYCKQCGCQLPT